MAEAKLANILAGADPEVLAAPASGATFAMRRWSGCATSMRTEARRRPPCWATSAPSTVGIPRFGHLPLEAITVDEADRWRRELVADGLSPATVNKLRWKCEAIYERAARVWSITFNPLTLVERQPQPPPDDFSVPEPTETMLLAAHAANDQDGCFFIVAAFTGLRLSELRALRWGT
jgi:integrase